MTYALFRIGTTSADDSLASLRSSAARSFRFTRRRARSNTSNATIIHPSQLVLLAGCYSKGCVDSVCNQWGNQALASLKPRGG